MFAASGGGIGATYTWNGAAGTASGVGNCSYTVNGATTGTKSVTAFAEVVAYGDVTCLSATSNIRTFEVMALPATPEITRVSAATVCLGTDVVFTASGSGAGVTYNWYGNVGTASGVGNCSYTVSGTATGTKSVTAFAQVAYDDLTCRSATSGAATAMVRAVPGTPAVTRVSAATVCMSLTDVVFTASGSGAGVTYNWYGNVGTASGVGNCSYTVSGAYSGTKSVTAFAEVAYGDVTCRSGTSGAATATVIALPATPTVTSSSRCTPGTVTLLASSPDAVIDWYTSPSGGTSLTTGNTYTTPSLTASATYYAQARNTATGCVSAWQTAVTATVGGVPSPSVTLSSGSNNQTVNSGEPIGTIVYTASNATTIYQSDTLPPGVSSSVTNNTTLSIYGTPSSTGTFTYSVSSSHTNGCVSSTVTGTIAVYEAPPSFASTQTWVYGGLTWSDRLVGPSTCNIGTFTHSNDIPHCRSYNVGGTLRYYYNWTYVNANQSTMCPSPWRVPTKADFDALVSATDATTLINAWGFGGYAFGSSVYYGTTAYYWSSTEIEDRTFAYHLHYDNVSQNATASDTYKFVGLQVRCVK
jgi:uncharacterized protein (TIGR02145 family)